MIAKKRMYLTADRKSVVEENDPKAAFLLVNEGGEIPDDKATELGLLGSKHSVKAVIEPEETVKEHANHNISTRKIHKR